ncbi:hypothetical protein ABT025_04695 [Streptomyces sp. NPDC002809]
MSITAGEVEEADKNAGSGAWLSDEIEPAQVERAEVAAILGRPVSRPPR